MQGIWQFTKPQAAAVEIEIRLCYYISQTCKICFAHPQKSRTLQTANFRAFYYARQRHWSTPLLHTLLTTGSNLLGATKKVALIQGHFGSHWLWSHYRVKSRFINLNRDWSKSLCDRTNYPSEYLASKYDKQNKLESLRS